MAQKAYSTINTKLWYKVSQSGTYIQMPKIKSYPQLGAVPSMIETTDLEDEIVTKVLGVQDIGDMEFKLNFNIDDYNTCKNVASLGNVYFKLSFGEECYAEWQGTGSIYADGAEVNGVREMTFTIAPSTKPTFTKETPKYRITYNGNGNTSGTVPEATVITEGSTGTIAQGTGLVKDGHAFSKWNTVADGSGTDYSGGATSPTMTANLPLFAIYETT